MTAIEATVVTTFITVAIGGIFGAVGLWVASRARRAEKQIDADVSITITDRQEIYRLLNEQKATILKYGLEIAALHRMIDRANRQIGRSNAEIVRLNAVILWYRTQLEINHIPIAVLPTELMPRDFGQTEDDSKASLVASTNDT